MSCGGGDAGSLHSGAATFVTSNYFQVLGVRPVYLVRGSANVSRG